MTPSQCRAARALVAMSQDRLAEASGVAKRTIASFEKQGRQPYDRTIAALRAALEAEGVEFIPENGGGAGVRLTDSVIFSHEDRNVIQRKRRGKEPVYWVEILQEENHIALPNLCSRETTDFHEAREWAINGTWPGKTDA